MIALSLLVILTSTPERREFDAFLSDPSRQPLVDARTLTARAREQLAASVVSQTEPRYGVPTFLWATAPRATHRSYRSMGLSAEEAARRHLVDHAEIYRAAPSQWARAKVNQVHDLKDQGAVIVSFQQEVNAVRVFRDEIRVIMNAQLDLVALAGYLTPATGRLGDFKLSAEAAIGSAYQALTGTSLSGAVDALENSDGYGRFAIDQEATPVRTKTVWFALPNGLEPAWSVEIELTKDDTSSELFSVLVSARNGAVLSRHSLTQSDAYGYRVWADPVTHFPSDGPQGTSASPHPTGLTDRFHPPFVAPALISLQNGPISTNDPWLAPGSTQASGNNVKAYADLKKPNGYSGGDVLGVVSGSNSFDYQYDLASKPAASQTQQLAAIAQLFYTTNFLHDWYYDVGFDEKAGNAQLSNLNRGGKNNDPLLAEAQDYSGRNNANMSTPADGASPRMQMYTWNAYATTSLKIGGATFDFGTAQFGPQEYDVTAPLAAAESADGKGATDACTAIKPVTGMLVVADRGTCTFVKKTQVAQAAGAVGIIIIDNVDQEFPIRLAGTATVTIPAVGVTMTAGNSVRAAIGTSAQLLARTNIDPDGSIDNTIVAHEWGHYIAHRLIGDANGLPNLQAGGMGEGWSDFHALLMMVRAEDAQVPANANFNGVYALAAYALYGFTPDAYYYGIRRVPYSTDVTKNALSFRHIQDGNALPDSVPTLYGLDGVNNSEVHNTGEVWASMLWECYASLLRDSRYTFDQARDRMRAYLVASYKATPVLPTFIDARDAMLAVAVAKDPTDYANFWRAFAKRGIGMGAVGPDRDSPDNSPVIESSLVGKALTITNIAVEDLSTSCDHDGNLDADESGTALITVRNVGIGTVSGSTLTVSTTFAPLTFPSGATATVPSIEPFQSTVVQIPVKLAKEVTGVLLAPITVSIADATLVQTPVTLTSQVRLNFDLVPNAAGVDNVEAPMSQWATGAAAEGDTTTPFRVFAESSTEHWWFGPSSAFNADTYLVSPTLEVSTGFDFVLSFKHRYDFEATLGDAENPSIFYDGAIVELSTDDGMTWADIGSMGSPGYGGTINPGDDTIKLSSNTLSSKKAFVGRSKDYPAFNTETINLHTSYAGQKVKVRFHIATDDAVGLKGWEIDDIGFTGITKKPFVAIVSDPNSCVNKAPVVMLPADQEVSEGASVTLNAVVSDPDGDTVTQTWTQVSGALVHLDSAQHFTAPATRADMLLIFEFTATDGRAVVGPLTYNVRVKTNNHAPTASAPATMSAAAQAHVSIQGSGTDPDGDTLTYQWTQLSGPAITFVDATAAKLEFDAPKVDADTTVTLQLVVNDGGLSSEPVKVDLTIKRSACGCSSFEGSLIGLAGLVGLLRRRRRS